VICDVAQNLQVVGIPGMIEGCVYQMMALAQTLALESC
jgi:hypothetical protein